MVNFSSYKFLIIGGASKAGTTSVFNYLASHPQICAAEAKETRFFLDADYPLRSEKRCESDGPEAYLYFFDEQHGGTNGEWRLEATPDYLYSASSARLIHETLPHVRFVFLLREPVSRLLSFYQFGQQLNEVPGSMSFDQYVELQKNNADANFLSGYRHPAFCALQHGRYSAYLKPFIELFGRSAIHVAFYEELRGDPGALMSSICRWAGLDETYFEGYSFEVRNKGSKMRSPRLHRLYFEARREVRRVTRDYPYVRSTLRQLGRQVNSLYRKMNVTNREEIAMSHSTKEFVAAYYREESTRLERLLGIEVPWADSDVPYAISRNQENLAEKS